MVDEFNFDGKQLFAAISSTHRNIFDGFNFHCAKINHNFNSTLIPPYVRTTLSGLHLRGRGGTYSPWQTPAPLKLPCHVLTHTDLYTITPSLSKSLTPPPFESFPRRRPHSDNMISNTSVDSNTLHWCSHDHVISIPYSEWTHVHSCSVSK